MGLRRYQFRRFEVGDRESQRSLYEKLNSSASSSSLDTNLYSPHRALASTKKVAFLQKPLFTIDVSASFRNTVASLKCIVKKQGISRERITLYPLKKLFFSETRHSTVHE